MCLGIENSRISMTSTKLVVSRSVEVEFARLSKYAPRMVKDPVDRIRRFRDGLKLEIRSQLVPLNFKEYNELYERAQLIERDMTERVAAFRLRYVPARDNQHFGKKSMEGNRHFVPPIRKNFGKPAYYSNTACRSCGKEA